MSENVVICVDASEQAADAFAWYVNHIHRAGNNIFLLHAPEIESLAMSSAGSMSFSPGVWQNLYQKENAASKQLEHDYSQRLKEAGLPGKWVTVNHGGKPAEAIVKAAQEVEATLLVMGTRGMGTVRRTIFGSVSDYVLHHAHCPVAVYRH
ncbi:DgyrCDS10395 [Dimorphilus gyrociliatus]|uniref:DgyrCDS10395 n=1 Tax=Dimorphilus gyrociliatus TaxID=2664684 RepID=A0A7I8W172_9ANNE|nr:DgyrCDS10395 [Dimorphilus gyrociliatus]